MADSKSRSPLKEKPLRQPGQSLLEEREKIWDPWAQEMIALLLQALAEVDLAGAPLTQARQAWFEGQWSELLHSYLLQ